MARSDVNDRKKLTGPMANRRVYERLNALTLGESFTLMRADWKTTTSPTDALRYTKNYRGRFSVRRLDDGTGWVIWRLK
jgi:hypothetical protein